MKQKKLIIFIFIIFCMPGIRVLADYAHNLEEKLKHTDNYNKLELLLKLANNFSESNPAKSLKYAEMALPLSVQLKDNQRELEAVNLIGDYYSSVDNYRKAIEYYIYATKIYEKLGKRDGLAYTLISIGILYKSIGEYNDALEYHKSALDIYQKMNNKAQVAAVYNNIGSIYNEQASYDKAIEYYFKALTIKEELKDTKSIATTLNNLGNVYAELRNYKESLMYLKRALKIREDIDDKKGVGSTLNNIGSVYQAQADYQNALKYYQRSYEIRNKINDFSGAAAALNNIGGCYEGAGDFQSALTYYNKTLRQYEALDIAYGVATSKLNIGNIYIKLRDFDNAIRTIEGSISYSREKGIKKVLALSYYSLSLLYSNFANYRKSDEYYHRFEQVRDSLYSEENNKKVADMQVKYKTEAKEKENQILRKEKEIAERKLAEQRKINYYTTAVFFMLILIALILIRISFLKKRHNNILLIKNQELESNNYELILSNEKLLDSEIFLKEVIKTKDKLFEILAEDIKTPLAGLVMSAAVLHDHMEKMEKDKIVKTSGTISVMSHHTSNVVENLLNWSRTQSEAINFNPEILDLDYKLREIVSIMSGYAVAKEITVDVEGDRKLQINCDANLFYNSLRILLSNAIKFTGHQGRVTVRVAGIDSYAAISIIDTGVGINDMIKSQIFTMNITEKSIGTGGEPGSGLGLVLCKEFVEKNKGIITFDSTQGVGSIFTFTVPLAPEEKKPEKITRDNRSPRIITLV